MRSVVGDSLGAPFEFGPPGQFTARFPASARGLATEMCGGGPWQPGQWTDDTEMALLVAASLVEHDGLNEPDLFDRFRTWAAAGPTDIGIQTRAVLSNGHSWQEAAGRHYAAGHRSAGNGSLMRTTPAAIYFARHGDAATADAGRRISDLTHGDPAARDACVVYHLLTAAALDGHDPLAVLPSALDTIPAKRRGKWDTVLAPEWTPEDATESNGAVWPTLGSAVWALRHHDTLEAGLRAVIDLGGDTDTVAAVTGGLLGAVHGIGAIPARWATVVHGHLPGHDPVATGLPGLQQLALALDGHPAAHRDDPGGGPSQTPGIEPVEVLPGLWLSDLDGAARAPQGYSCCPCAARSAGSREARACSST